MAHPIAHAVLQTYMYRPKTALGDGMSGLHLQQRLHGAGAPSQRGRVQRRQAHRVKLVYEPRLTLRR